MFGRETKDELRAQIRSLKESLDLARSNLNNALDSRAGFERLAERRWLEASEWREKAERYTPTSGPVLMTKDELSEFVRRMPTFGQLHNPGHTIRFPFVGGRELIYSAGNLESIRPLYVEEIRLVAEPIAHSRPALDQRGYGLRFDNVVVVDDYVKRAMR